MQPGHIFPLMAQRGGVLVRAGHTEAGCDLAQLAGDELVPPPWNNLKPEQIELLTATGFLRMAPDGTGGG